MSFVLYKCRLHYKNVVCIQKMSSASRRLIHHSNMNAVTNLSKLRLPGPQSFTLDPIAWCKFPCLPDQTCIHHRAAVESHGCRGMKSPPSFNWLGFFEVQIKSCSITAYVRFFLRAEFCIKLACMSFVLVWSFDWWSVLVSAIIGNQLRGGRGWISCQSSVAPLSLVYIECNSVFWFYLLYPLTSLYNSDVYMMAIWMDAAWCQQPIYPTRT